VATKKVAQQVENILAAKAEIVGIGDIKVYHQNPRVGNLEAIRESLRENGQFRPLIVQRSTGEIIGGNHTWKAAKAEGWSKISVVYLDVDDARAAKIVLADNRTNDLATYDTDILAELLRGVPDAVGTGYDDEAVAALLDSAVNHNKEIADQIIRPSVTITPLGDDGEVTAEPSNYVGGPQIAGGENGSVYQAGADDNKIRDEEADNLDAELGQLQGILQLREDMQFLGNNYYDIPDLSSAGLLEALPKPLDTWGGHDATPDDGKTWWVWNYGVAGKKNLPMDRAILCFYTYDHHFESFWEQPAFMTAKVLNAGIKIAVVPDFSYYSETGVASWVWNTFRAQWLGRYFQEAGIKVIPRIQYAIEKKDSPSLDFCTMGIPKGCPIVAKSSHNANSKEEFDLEVYGLIKCLEKVEAKTLLIYGGKPAVRVLETADPVGKGLVEEVVHIYNYAHKRRGVVFDKKEGMKSQAYRAMTKKEREQRAKDKTADDEDLNVQEAAQEQPEDDAAL
jgi:hypothetical protein